MDFDVNCYRALLISFSILHILCSTGVVVLMVYISIWNSLYQAQLVPDRYQLVVIILGIGACVSFVSSFVGWCASGFSRVRGSVIYVIGLAVSLVLLLFSSLMCLYASSQTSIGINQEIKYPQLFLAFEAALKMKYGETDSEYITQVCSIPE